MYIFASPPALNRNCATIDKSVRRAQQAAEHYKAVCACSRAVRALPPARPPQHRLPRVSLCRACTLPTRMESRGVSERRQKSASRTAIESLFSVWPSAGKPGLQEEGGWQASGSTPRRCRCERALWHRRRPRGRSPVRRRAGGKRATARLLTGADVSRQLTAHKGAGAREQVPHTKTGRART